MTKYAGEEFLNKIYKDLVNSEIVKHTGKGGNKNEDVHIYMERLERVTNNSFKHDKLSLLKNFYYDKYVIKPKNVPESYFKQQEQIALDRGYGHVHYTDERYRKQGMQTKLLEEVIRYSVNNKLCELGLSTDSDIAISLYKKFGFEFDDWAMKKEMK